MKCLGRTKTLRRCSREADVLFCHQHRWQSILALIVSVPTMLGLFLNIQTLYKSSFPEIPKLPIVLIKSSPIDSPGGEDKPLTFAQIKDRRRQILEIRNPNKVEILNVQLNFQFPEAILSIKPSVESMHYNVTAFEVWDEQPLVITGDASKSITVEPFAKEEKTGLWKTTINHVPAESTIAIIILTAVGQEGGFYSRSAENAEKMTFEKGLLWYIEGKYQYNIETSTKTADIFIPLIMDRLSRSIKSSVVYKTVPENANKVTIRQGRGARIPGVINTRGYLYLEDVNSGVHYASVFANEGGKNIDAKFGVFGTTKKQPGFEVNFKRSGLKTYLKGS